MAIIVALIVTGCGSKATSGPAGADRGTPSSSAATTAQPPGGDWGPSASATLPNYGDVVRLQAEAKQFLQSADRIKRFKDWLTPLAMRVASALEQHKFGPYDRVDLQGSPLTIGQKGPGIIRSADHTLMAFLYWNSDGTIDSSQKAEGVEIEQDDRKIRVWSDAEMGFVVQLGNADGTISLTTYHAMGYPTGYSDGPYVYPTTLTEIRELDQNGLRLLEAAVNNKIPN